MTTKNNTDLDRLTKRYWDQHQHDIVWYLSNLLPKELDYAHNHPLSDGTPRLRCFPQPVHTLAMTVGEANEPLLQSICVFRPQRLVFILNETYNTTTGTDRGLELLDYVKRLAGIKTLGHYTPPQYTDANIVACPIEADTPTDVFRALRDKLQHADSQAPIGTINVVDITGAKKSMVVGAFLYAAHSRLPISYVDFDNYDRDSNRPYGYTCKIGRIDDPYEAFQLRDWERVRQLYLQYNFRGARTLLAGDVARHGILHVMQRRLDANEHGSALYNTEDVQAVERLARILEVYEAWDTSDFAGAYWIATDIGPSLPPELIPWAISELENCWPDAAIIGDAAEAARQLYDQHHGLKQGKPTPDESFFSRLHRFSLLAYIRDEYAKIERVLRLNRDNRSAFLRAAALHELLLKARLALCWLNNTMELCEKDTTSTVVSRGRSRTLAPTDFVKWFSKIIKASGADQMRKVLQKMQPFPPVDSFSAYLTDDAPLLAPYWRNHPLDFDTLKDKDNNPLVFQLRNEAIHTHLSIPPIVAASMVELVALAVTDFEKNWLEHFYPDTLAQADGKPLNAPEWASLCELCQLRFLPPELKE